MNDSLLRTEIENAMTALQPELRSADLLEGLCSYLELLLATNTRINLVSRKDTLKHVVRFTRESLYLARLLHKDRRRIGATERAPRLLDLGSGGGFPGLVLKLVLGDAETALVESTQKKARFLAEVCQSLDLRGMTVLWARAEDLANQNAPLYRPDYRHAFDWVTAKALGSLKESTRLAIPFLDVGGAHWTFKGAGVQEELRSCERLQKQARLERFCQERIPGDEESYVIGLRRLPPV